MDLILFNGLAAMVSRVARDACGEEGSGPGAIATTPYDAHFGNILLLLTIQTQTRCSKYESVGRGHRSAIAH